MLKINIEQLKIVFRKLKYPSLFTSWKSKPDKVYMWRKDYVTSLYCIHYRSARSTIALIKPIYATKQILTHFTGRTESFYLGSK